MGMPYNPPLQGSRDSRDRGARSPHGADGGSMINMGQGAVTRRTGASLIQVQANASSPF
jgi:hypothetical protein